MPRRVYGYSYNWSDFDVLRELLRDCYRDDFVVAEVATGPNTAVPYALGKIAESFQYVSVDIERTHIRLQKKAIRTQAVEGVVGDATHLPLKKGCADIFVFHHAIDDILETRGSKGLEASIEEALSILKGRGCIIFSHSVFSYDPYTLDVDLSDVQEYLHHRIRGCFQRIDGPSQAWLVVKDIVSPRKSPV